MKLGPYNFVAGASWSPTDWRSMLAFRRVLAPDIVLVPYAATAFSESTEHYRPIWQEYLKLAAYALVAWK